MFCQNHTRPAGYDTPPTCGSMNGCGHTTQSTKNSLLYRLSDRARQRWPALTRVHVRHHGPFAYISGELSDGTTLPLCRLCYSGYANRWGFAIWLASKNGCENSVLPSGYLLGTTEEALDCACGLYLAWRTS